MGSDIADFNNDELADIMVADMRAPEHYRFHENMVGMHRNKFERMLKEGYHYQYMQNTLQMHRGLKPDSLPLFSEVAQMAGISATDWSWSTLFFDMDNDGWKDLFVSNGIRRDIQNRDTWTEIRQAQNRDLPYLQLQQMFPEQPLQNYIYHNQQKLSFADYSATSGVDVAGFTNGASYADLDNDGDLDLVLNNLDSPALVYQNLSQEKQKKSYVQLQLQGSKDNHFGLGAKVKVRADGQSQFLEMHTTRGFQSSVPPRLHFGLNNAKVISQIEVEWPNGERQVYKNVATNQLLTILQDDTTNHSLGANTNNLPLVQIDTLKKFIKTETFNDDFAQQALLAFKNSTHGQFVRVADVNQDGLDDYYLSGYKDLAPTLYLQYHDGTFAEKPQPAFLYDLAYEDTDAQFFDADQDGDLDLYVGSGSTEFPQTSPLLADRLYVNDGNANFSRVELPLILNNTSSLAVSDFDEDGDMDVFVGGFAKSGEYPEAYASYLLINEPSGFSYQALDFAKLVKDAVWFDIDKDDDQDLIVVGHWMYPMVFKNEDGVLSDAEALNISNELKQGVPVSALWNSIAAADLDMDGHVDLVLGNIGLNNRFTQNKSQRMYMHTADYDNNGSRESLLSYTKNDTLFPLIGRDKLLKQLPGWQKFFPNYHSFAQASTDEILSHPSIQTVHKDSLNQFRSVVLYHEGGLNFSMHSLPDIAQIASVNHILITDLNDDTQPDLIIAGNDKDWEVESTNNDTGLGLCLINQGQRIFSPLSISRSGFYLQGVAFSLQKIEHSSGAPFTILATDQDGLYAFRPYSKLNL